MLISGANTFENAYTQMWIESGILYVIYKSDFEVNIDIAKECVEARIAFSEGKKYPILFDTRSIKSIDLESRRYLAKGRALEYISAGAFLIKNHIHLFMGNTWIFLKPFPVPSRMFTSEDEAIKWLEYYKNLN